MDNVVRAQAETIARFPALAIVLKNPSRFCGCSVFVPIVQPMTAGWSRPALEKHLVPSEAGWRAYDVCALMEDGYRFREFLVDQGIAGSFLDAGLRPWLLETACWDAGMPLTLRM